ncbi:MAG: TauD/TfdA family dioxygenase [Betaproteobacteria bacterium]|nr:TauD/TfdA family dioxygenase [Betaproteobacteria bacterium]
MIQAETAVKRNLAVCGEAAIDPADWTGSELAARNDWMHRLSGGEIASLKAMAVKTRDRFGSDPNSLLRTTVWDFDLGEFAGPLGNIKTALRDGLGLTLVRGLPIDDLTSFETAAIYWGIGRHLGHAVTNNPIGDMIGHVVDLGKDYANPQHRGYQTNAAMDYHSDHANIVGLLCMQTAKSGGISKLTSSIAVYNEVLRRRRDLIEELSQPYCWTKHAEVNPHENPYYESPVFNFLDGYLCTSFGSKHMEKGHALPGAPPMTARQFEALQLTKAVCEELHYAMVFEPGDMQFLNNSVVLHSRTDFQDWPEPSRKRRLWRLWLAAPDMRPLTPFSRQWRHGIRVEGTIERVVLV